jgi:hypothetical protein
MLDVEHWIQMVAHNNYLLLARSKPSPHWMLDVGCWMLDVLPARLLPALCQLPLHWMLDIPPARPLQPRSLSDIGS